MDATPNTELDDAEEALFEAFASIDAAPNTELDDSDEVLFEAATRSEDVDSITHCKLSTTLEELKASFSSGLYSVSQTLAASNSDFDGKINTTNQHLSDLKREVSDLKEAAVKVATLLATQTIVLQKQDAQLATQTIVLQKQEKQLATQTSVLQKQEKQQRLFWALDHTHLGSFDYYEKGSSNTFDSSTWAAAIISCIIRGYGCGVSSSASIEKDYGNSKELESGQEAFRLQLKEQIKDLIGREPRLTKGKDGKSYEFFYE